MITYFELAALFKNRNQKDLESLWPVGPTVCPVIRKLFQEKAAGRQTEKSVPFV